MERLILTNENVHEAAMHAVRVLDEAGIILYPTDTLYGLGVNAEDPNALRALFDLKGREEGKPVSVIVPDFQTIERIAKVSPTALRIIEHFLPGALTIVLPRKEGIGTIGIRIPDDPFCRALSHAYQKPITATSANISGERTVGTVEAIVQSFSNRAEQIRLAIDAGSRTALHSTVVECLADTPKILREGAISRAALEPYL